MADETTTDDVTETDAATDETTESATAEVDPAAKLESDLSAQKKVNRDLERKYKAAMRELDGLKAAPKPDADAPDPEALKAEGRREAQEAANGRIVRAEIRAAAGGKLNDPADAVLHLNVADFEVDDDGNVDQEAIADAIADLLKTKPYLAVQDGKRFKGDGDGGARKGSQVSIDDQIAEAEKAGDFARSISLKRQKAYASNP